MRWSGARRDDVDDDDDDDDCDVRKWFVRSWSMRQCPTRVIQLQQLLLVL